MPRRQRELWTCDCETDPFRSGRIPQPFIWGAYRPGEFRTFQTTEDFIMWAAMEYAFFYAHNGGKFDFMYLLPFIGEETRPQIINGRVVSVQIGDAIFRDSYSIIPTALSKYKKDEIDYSLFEASVRDSHMPVITEYLKGDCTYLHEMVSEYREIAGKRTTIAANALGYCKKLGIDPGKTNRKFDMQFRPFYFGGRVEAFKGGKVNGGVQILDINSAYPYAMKHKHPTGYRFTVNDEPDGADFVMLHCTSHGAFPRKEKEKLTFPHDTGLFMVTKWEYETAVKWGLIENVEIRNCFHFDEHIDFGRYVDHWFKLKQFAEDTDQPAKRLIAKIMMNSLYGKLAQNPFNYSDYKIVPLGDDVEDGWHRGTICGDYEIHERDAGEHLAETWGDLLDEVPLFLNVGTASSVTGFVRAMLVEAMQRVGPEKVAYCDTDCLFIADPSDVSHRLDVGSELGQWKPEGAADAVYIGGRKMYATTAMREPSGAPMIKDGKPWRKTACKGARLDADQIQAIALGAEIMWHNEAPTFRLGRDPVSAVDPDAFFVVRKIRATVSA